MAHIELKGYYITIDGEEFEIPSTLVFYKVDPYHSIPITIDRIEDLVKLAVLLKDKEFAESLYKLNKYSEIEYGKIIRKVINSLEDLKDLTNKEAIENIKNMVKKRALYIGIIKGHVNIINIVNDNELLELFMKISENKNLFRKYAKYIVENIDKLKNKEEVEKLKDKIKKSIVLSESGKNKYRELMEYILSTINAIKQKIAFDYIIEEPFYHGTYTYGVKLHDNNIVVIDLYKYKNNIIDEIKITLIDKETNVYTSEYTDIYKLNIQNYQIAKILKLFEENRIEELIDYLKSKLKKVDNENHKRILIDKVIDRLSQINDEKIRDVVFRLKALLI